MPTSTIEDGPDWTNLKRLRSLGIVFGLMILALTVSDLLAALPLSLSTQSTGTVSNLWFAAGTAASFIGMALVGALYLFLSGRGIEYIDVERPSRSTARYVLLGVASAIIVMMGFNILAYSLNLPVAESWVATEIGTDLQMFVLFFLLVFLFNAPAEEFLFRNVLQKRLAEVYSTASSIVLISTLFAMVHIPGYLIQASVMETMVPIALIFGVSITFGLIYAYTEDLVVAAVSHAIYNAIQLALYLPSVT